MRRITRRAVLRGAAAVPIVGPMVEQHINMQLAGLTTGLGGGGDAEGACDSPELQRVFREFATWFTEVGDKMIREQARNVHMLDPDIVEMQSPALWAKIRMQEKRNYARILADKKNWFERTILRQGLVKHWG